MNRRKFLQLGLASGASAFAGWSCSGRKAAAGLETAGNTTRAPAPSAPGSWNKRGVILAPSEPWEGNHVQNFTARAEPLDGDRWRIWYSVSGSTSAYRVAFAEGIPGETMTKTPALCSPGDLADAPFSIGNLPDRWKPVQPVHIRLRDGRHRLYFWAHGPSVCRYLAAESSDGRRYRVLDPLRPVLYHPNDRAAHGVPTPDGVMLSNTLNPGRPGEEPLAKSHLISNDATNVYLLPDGSFELYTVALKRVSRDDPAYVPEDNAPGLIRCIDRMASNDGIHFTDRRRVIERDKNDPPDQQFYFLSVTHTPRGRIGMLGSYLCARQTVDVEWCFSSDGVQWQRTPGGAWIERGAPPSPDCYGIYAPSRLVQHDRQWHLFYTAANHTHNGKITSGERRQCVMWARTKNISV